MLNSNVSKESAERFGKWLGESNYPFIYKTMAGIFNTVEPWIDESRILEMLENVSIEDKLIVEFFLLGYEKEKDTLLKILGRENLEFILNCGFAVENENKIEPEGFVILPINTLFLIVSLPSCYQNAKKRMSDIYIGSDSTKLMKYIRKENYAKVLDLCAGSGVQGLNVADYSDKIVEVELNDIAYNAAVLNAKINGISEEKYEVRKGDLYQVVDEHFDCIISNPPFVPVPKDIVFPLCGDGGEDGLDLVRKIVAGYEHFLNPSGKAYMVLECIGNEAGPYIVDCMKSILKSGVINVSLINRQQIEFQADASAKIAIEIYEDPQNYDRYYNAWMEMFHKTQAVYIYPVVIEYINNGHPLKINIIKNYNKWSLDSEFETVPNLDIKKREQEYYEADVDAKCKAIFDSEVKSLLETARGKKLRENIVLTDSPKVIIAKIKKLLNTANSLEEKGVIIPK
jgi:methylase of polypeptide subunit release factors